MDSLHPESWISFPHLLQLLGSSGQAADAASSAALNVSLSALPVPLLNLQQGADVQQQALQYYRAATTFGNGTGTG